MYQFFGFIISLIFIRILLGMMGVKFAPLNVSRERRLQVLAAGAYMITCMLGEILMIILTIYLMRTSIYWIVAIYVIIVAQQRNTVTYGLKSSEWVRNWTWWHYASAYFPIKLVKTVDLNPDQNYLFCVFPHGVLATGCVLNFATAATHFKDIFPNMKSHMATLQGLFIVPFFRELISHLGMIASSHDALDYVLDKKNGTGKCVSLVVGGAAESLNCHHGLYKVVLKKRKGFVKIAMKHGVPLVPVISFGENEIFEQFDNPEGSIFRKIQDWIRQKTGVAPVIPLGRGLFQYSFGIIPHRKPINTVVGKPIEVPKNLDPNDDEIKVIHDLFMKDLQELFDKKKHKYLSQCKDARLIIE